MVQAGDVSRVLAADRCADTVIILRKACDAEFTGVINNEHRGCFAVRRRSPGRREAIHHNLCGELPAMARSAARARNAATSPGWE